ncbi:AMP-binding enzyme family protein [Histomonas meleagridis]|uniref:AMP-binding enzyme family protein n=1 Tax=Histomonas meleagridis TaxID=135588 RepID=UPI00355A75BA|nr:AMP-binding enzyme family protein [Histomonas meleagridis]KAH0803721.1 AMP-binding enzyme family protein [Histomonas meleagridis]
MNDFYKPNLQGICCNDSPEDPSFSSIYRNIRCFTENDGQTFGTFPRFPTIFTLRDLLYNIADTYNAFPAFGSKSDHNTIEWITYHEFYELVFSFSLGLKHIGVQAGQSVAVIMESSTWFALSQWSLGFYGAVMVPIRVNQDQKVIPIIIDVLDCHYLLCSIETFPLISLLASRSKKLQAIIIVCDSQNLQNISEKVTNFKNKQHSIPVYDLPKLLEDSSNEEKIFQQIYATSPAVISFGSATCGTLNPSILTHANVIASAVGLTSSGYHFGRDIYLSTIPMYYIFERSMQLVILAYGGCIGFVEGEYIEALKLLKPTIISFTGQEIEIFADDILQETSGTNWFKRVLLDFVFSVVSQTEEANIKIPWLFENTILESLKQKVGGRLKLIVTSMMDAQVRVLHFLRTVLQVPIIQVYGTAETGGVISVQHVSSVGYTNVGAPCTSCEIKLRDFDEARIKVKDDKMGEILVKGQNVFVGYKGNKNLTKKVLSDDGWFATGDIGRINMNGEIELSDTVQNFRIRMRPFRRNVNENEN